jgi:hypothetical protein
MSPTFRRAAAARAWSTSVARRRRGTPSHTHPLSEPPVTPPPGSAAGDRRGAGRASGRLWRLCGHAHRTVAPRELSTRRGGLLRRDRGRHRARVNAAAAAAVSRTPTRAPPLPPPPPPPPLPPPSAGTAPPRTTRAPCCAWRSLAHSAPAEYPPFRHPTNATASAVVAAPPLPLLRA